MKRNLLLLLIACFLAGPNIQAQSPEEKEVMAAVETLRKAMLDADKPALEKITAEELSYGHSSGKIEDKAAFVESLVSGKSDFMRIDLSEQMIHVVGNTAIVRHKLSGEINDGGKPGSVNIGILLIWQKQEGAWRLLARQAFKL